MIARRLFHNADWKLCAAAAFAAYAGMLYDHARHLWARDYFQFFPVFLIAVGGLTFERIRTSAGHKKNRWKVGLLSTGLSVAALAAALFFGSPWLGAVSFFLFGNALLSQIPNARRAWRLFVLLIPLPLGADRQLILKLQQISSVRAGQVLDMLGVPHLMQGTVLEFSSKRFFVEEACSGLGSIYLMLAATAFYAVLTDMRLVRAVPLLVSVLWWAIVMNILRIVAIAAGHFYFELDLSTGWQHETLGVFAMLFAFLGISATGLLINYVFASIGDDRFIRDSKSIFLSPVTLWNLVTTRDRNMISTTRDQPVGMEFSSRRLTLLLAAILCCAGVTYWSIAAAQTLSWWNRNSAPSDSPPQMTAEKSRPFQMLDSSVLKLAGITEVSETETQDDETIAQAVLSGVRSKSWTTLTPTGDIMISVTGPFPGWHDSRPQLEFDGWKQGQTTVHAVPGQLSGRHLVMTRMLRQDSTRAHLYFCLMRPNGELLSVPLRNDAEGLMQPLRDRFHRVLGPKEKEVLWHIQLLVQIPGQTLESEVQNQQDLFGRIVLALQHHWRNHSLRNRGE